eukprot:515622-Hanusia_phi.AAC.1
MGTSRTTLCSYRMILSAVSAPWRSVTMYCFFVTGITPKSGKNERKNGLGSTVSYDTNLSSAAAPLMRASSTVNPRSLSPLPRCLNSSRSATGIHGFAAKLRTSRFQ